MSPLSSNELCSFAGGVDRNKRLVEKNLELPDSLWTIRVMEPTTDICGTSECSYDGGL